MSGARFLVNPHRDPDLSLAPPPLEPTEFHRSTEGYAPTSLRCSPTLERLLEAEAVWVKDETARMGLPAFKMLGASWAARALLDDRGLPADERTTLVAGTDGNHGRAVARAAATLGLRARIYVPKSIAPGRRARIIADGAEVVDVDGDYDETIERAAGDEGEGVLVLADTAWDGYRQVPAWIVDGYATLFREVDDALEGQRPDMLAVQIGVGSLAQAAITWAHADVASQQMAVVGVEPLRAACAMASAERGEAAHVPGPHESNMDCLHAGVPSRLALPVMMAGVDTFVAIEDEWAERAVEALAADGIATTPTGGAGAAGMLALQSLGVGPPTRGRTLLVIATEGPDASTEHRG